MALTEKYTGKLSEGLVLARTRASDLESVCKLNCWGSSIKDVSIVREMPNLEVCSLSVNEVNTLEDFSHCHNLQELYIRKNNVKTLTDIQYLKRLPKLRVLWLSENPCSGGDNYRQTVLKTLPNLHKLDNIAVTEEEVQDAVNGGDELPPLPSPKLSTQPIKSFHTDLLVDQQPIDSLEIEQPKVDSIGNIYEKDHGDVESESVGLHDSPSCYTKDADGQSRLSPLRNIVDKKEDVVTLSWEETNHIRKQLGLKPLPKSSIIAAKSNPTSHTKAKNANILQCVLLLVKELDRDSLEEVDSLVKARLESL